MFDDGDQADELADVEKPDKLADELTNDDSSHLEAP